MSLGDDNKTPHTKSQPASSAAPNEGVESAPPRSVLRSKSRKGALLGVALVLLLSVVGIFLGNRLGTRETSAPPGVLPPAQRILLEDVRLCYDGPYRNIHPDVAYVGDESCISCHRAETESFHAHPMGHSVLPIDKVAPLQNYDLVNHNPFEALGCRFLVERVGEGVRHRQTRFDPMGQPIFDYAVDVSYVVGSGRGGYSYLTDHEGYLFQTAISWFTQKQRWDLSPGFDVNLVMGRPITSDCLFCHANRVHVREGYRNRYDKPIFDGYSIGCERCHGPGQRHVATTEKLDIVNPKRLPPGLQDAICEQCHLEGSVRVLPRGRGLYDFRPGLFLEDFWSVFVAESEIGEERVAVTHVEQIHESHCYQNSSGSAKLQCASCHSPHNYLRPAERVAHYRASCLTSACHETHGCSTPLSVRLKTSKEDSCIDCHMPRQQAIDVAHTAVTDHRIIRRIRQKSATPLGGFGSRGLLVPFGRPHLDPSDARLGRDYGIALIQAASQGQIPRTRASALALAALRRSLTDEDIDSDAWQAKGWALLLQNKGEEALIAFRKALSQQPGSEVAMTGAAEAASYAGRVDEALDLWRRAAATNPWMPIYRKQLALLLMRKQNWAEVRSQCQDWMRLDPASAEARMLWVTCLIRLGDKDKARAEFSHIEALQPPNIGEFRKMFAEQMP